MLAVVAEILRLKLSLQPVLEVFDDPLAVTGEVDRVRNRVRILELRVAVQIQLWAVLPSETRLIPLLNQSVEIVS